jgi:hypothetical protein
MSELEGFLWALPANILFAWLMFVEARMIVMDERPDRLPRDLPFVMERQRCMRAAVIILLLFNMTITGIMAMMRALTEIPNIDKNMAASIGVMFLLGFMLWGIRLAVAHILAAVGYPIRAFLAKVHGMMFSLRLLGMGFLAALPFLFLIQLIINMLFPKTTDFSEDQITLMVAVLAPISILFPLVLNAAAVFALKDLLGKSR